MSPKVTELLTSALSLSPVEREELADCLWASLDPSDSLADMTEDEFVAELNRRAAELKSDPSQGVPWNYLVELSDDGTQPDKPEAEVILLPPTSNGMDSSTAPGSVVEQGQQP